MEGIFSEIRQALRTFRKNPGFTVTALAALSIGIGANTGIFSVVNRVLLQPLPYKDPESLVQLGRRYKDGNGFSNSIPKYMMWRNNKVFSRMTIFDQEGPGLNLSSGDHPQQIKGAHVSADYFQVFGASPMIGRTFSANEDLPNGPKAVVISESLWKTHFGSDPGILKRTIVLNSETYPVIGVMPASFEPLPEAAVWVAVQADPNSANQGHYLSVAARLKPGVTLKQAELEMQAVGERFRRLYPKSMAKDESVAVVNMREYLVRGMKSALYVLMAAVAFVLLIACANVANLLLARSATRQRELAIRAAVGASRGRVIRQLLTESLLLSGAGGVIGLLLGIAGVRALLLLVPGDIPRLSDPDQLQSLFSLVDWRILVFTLGVSMFSGILFGLFPALQISNPNLASTLKEAGTRSATSRHQNVTRKVLVAVEMALALVLLASSALLIRTFADLSTAELGIDPKHVVTLFTTLSGSRYQTTKSVDLLAHRVLEQVAALPGVEGVSTSISLATQGSIDLTVNIPGRAIPAGQDYNGDEQWRSVSAGYFKVFRIPVQRGRVFNEHDTNGSLAVAVVNASFAKKYFPTVNAVGQTIEIGRGIGPQFDDKPREIVGVVGDVFENGAASGKVPVMYIPMCQQQDGLTKLASTVLPVAWAVRSNMDEKQVAAAVTKEVQAVDAQIPTAQVKSMETVLQKSIGRQNFNMLLLSIFAGSALLLAAIGIYGLMSYSVQQQTQELGVRMALGADHGAVVGLVIKQGMKPALIGIAAGLGVAFGLTRLLKGLLYGVGSADPASFSAVTLILALVALGAVWIPARRAVKVDPLIALRSE